MSDTKKSGPFVRLQHEIFIQPDKVFGQLKFNNKLSTDKDQQNSGGVELGMLVGMQGLQTYDILNSTPLHLLAPFLHIWGGGTDIIYG